MYYLIVHLYNVNEISRYNETSKYTWWELYNKGSNFYEWDEKKEEEEPKKGLFLPTNN